MASIELIILLLLFWKVIYWAIQYFIYGKNQLYLDNIRNWFSSLWDLIKPTKDIF